MKNVEQAASYLQSQQLSIVTAESCTAGLVAGALADMPGCGTWFKAGYVTYSAGAKHRILGIDKKILEQNNLTSEEVAYAMVEGALRISDADIAVATTGVAGPGPGEGGIPPGTVCFAWGFRHTGRVVVFTETRKFDGDRNEVRVAATDYVIGEIPRKHGSLVHTRPEPEAE